MENNYNNLSPKVKEVFNKLGFSELEDMGKPYYAGLQQGKIYNVKGSNKLREMKDGSTPKKYGSLKLKQINGTFKSFKVHRLIARFKPNPENKPIVHHKTGLKDHNGIDEIEWVTQSENIKYYYADKKTKNDTEATN